MGKNAEKTRLNGISHTGGLTDAHTERDTEHNTERISGNRNAETQKQKQLLQKETAGGLTDGRAAGVPRRREPPAHILTPCQNAKDADRSTQRQISRFEYIYNSLDKSKQHMAEYWKHQAKLKQI